MKFLPFFFLLAACAGGAKDDRITTILALTGDTTAGETVYSTNCTGCHGADATGGSGPSLVAAFAEGEDEEMLDYIINGDGEPRRSGHRRCLGLRRLALSSSGADVRPPSVHQDKT